ncbi:MAG: diguanylate cyclase, partial [Clostridia bacterium]|nr:diguanylate cyclase [Clostridia bacterium]
MGKNRSVTAVIQTYDKYADDPQKQIKELKRLVSEGRKSGDILMVGAAYCHLAIAYNDEDDQHGMLLNALKAVAILKDTCEYELLVKAYHVLGRAYINQGNNQMSLVCDETAYGIVKRHRLKGQIRITALNNVSVSYHAMEEPKKSIKYLNECLERLKKEYPEEYADYFMYSLNLAGCYKDIGELERADEIFDSINGLTEKVAFKPLVCDYYLRRSLVSYLRGDKASGNGYVDAALELFPKNIYPIPLYDDLCEVARAVTKNKDRARSKEIFDLMTVFAKNNSGTLEQLFATRAIANYYKNFGEHELALEYFSKYEELNDRQMRELKEMQMKLHNTARSAEAEIRKLKRKMRENEDLASLDPLSRLLNRSALLRVSSEFITSAAKKRQKVGVIFIDIDCFKECNDTYGHAKGDEIIREVAAVCRGCETKNVRFARYGGDEFFGLTRGLTDEEVREIARRICRDIRSADIPNEKNPNGGILTLSAGVINVAITEKTDTILEIANYADKALYHAKNAGRNAIYEL